MGKQPKKGDRIVIIEEIGYGKRILKYGKCTVQEVKIEIGDGVAQSV
jgi:hypothetical protein